MSWWKFWNKSDKVSDTPEKFRVKVITLKNGTKRFYPQVRNSVLAADWLCILKTHNGHIVLVDLSEFDLINYEYYHCNSEVEAIEKIEALKLQLAVERANEYESEEIIKL